jgi:hypothetical protein
MGNAVRAKIMSYKRFVIFEKYEGPPFETVYGTVTEESGVVTEVEEYDDEFTARVRVAILNHGLAKKKYMLEEQVEEGLFQEVDTDGDDED